MSTRDIKGQRCNDIPFQASWQHVCVKLMSVWSRCWLVLQSAWRHPAPHSGLGASVAPHLPLPSATHSPPLPTATSTQDINLEKKMVWGFWYFKQAFAYGFKQHNKGCMRSHRAWVDYKEGWDNNRDSLWRRGQDLDVGVKTEIMLVSSSEFNSYIHIPFLFQNIMILIGKKTLYFAKM